MFYDGAPPVSTDLLIQVIEFAAERGCFELVRERLPTISAEHVYKHVRSCWHFHSHLLTLATSDPHVDSADAAHVCAAVLDMAVSTPGATEFEHAERRQNFGVRAIENSARYGLVECMRLLLKHPNALVCFPIMIQCPMWASNTLSFMVAASDNALTDLFFDDVRVQRALFGCHDLLKFAAHTIMNHRNLQLLKKLVRLSSSNYAHEDLDIFYRVISSLLTNTLRYSVTALVDADLAFLVAGIKEVVQAYPCKARVVLCECVFPNRVACVEELLHWILLRCGDDVLYDEDFLCAATRATRLDILQLIFSDPRTCPSMYESALMLAVERSCERNCLSREVDFLLSDPRVVPMVPKRLCAHPLIAPLVTSGRVFESSVATIDTFLRATLACELTAFTHPDESRHYPACTRQLFDLVVPLSSARKAAKNARVGSAAIKHAADAKKRIERFVVEATNDVLGAE